MSDLSVGSGRVSHPSQSTKSFPGCTPTEENNTSINGLKTQTYDLVSAIAEEIVQTSRSATQSYTISFKETAGSRSRKTVTMTIVFDLVGEDPSVSRIQITDAVGSKIGIYGTKSIKGPTISKTDIRAILTNMERSFDRGDHQHESEELALHGVRLALKGF